MKVLLINKFLYPKGGDAIATLATGSVLAERGHDVAYWGMDHPDNPPFPYGEYFVPQVEYQERLAPGDQFKAAANILYSGEAKKRIERLLQALKPDIVHLNNFAHQISPSILPAIKSRGIPIVMTMHDYKLVCASYVMLRKGNPCEKCRKRRYYNCFLGRCTKNSLLKSFVNMLEMYLHHSIMNIYDSIDVFISPSNFMAEKVREMEFTKKIEYVPNFVNPGYFQPTYGGNRKTILFAGRLTPEKGVATLLDAVKGMDVHLRIAGDGPLKETLLKKIKNEQIDNAQFVGFKTLETLKAEMAQALFFVHPAEWYENNPRAIIEAFAMGKPVIGSRIGGIPELVKDNDTGLLFESRNADDLRTKISLLLEDDRGIVLMGKRARAFVERELNPDRYYERIMNVYDMAINHSKSGV